MLKRVFSNLILSAAIVAVFVLSIMTANAQFSYDDRYQNREYDDARASATSSTIRKKSILRGDDGGSLAFGRGVNRAEFVEMVVRALELTSSHDCGPSMNYRDVAYGAWYMDSLCLAIEHGLVRGYGDGTFRPQQPVNFAEAAVILLRARKEYSPPSGGMNWYQDSIDRLRDMDAVPLTVHAPFQALTRGEAAELIERALLEDDENRDDRYDDRRVHDRRSEILSPYFRYSSYDFDRLDRGDLPDDDIRPEDLYAWDQVAMGIVRLRGFPPTIAGKIYAALTVAQRDVIAIGDELGASSLDAIDIVSAAVLCRLSPEDCPSLQQYQYRGDRYATDVSAIVLQRIDEKLRQDTYAVAPVRPAAGEGIWNGTDPVTPAAANWIPWVLRTQSAYIAPPPPVGSSADRREIDEVRYALQSLTPEEIAAVHRWAGSKGSETPGGLWLTITNGLLTREDADVRRAADVRSTVMMAVADGFIACWRMKFIYWTARPNQRDTAIRTIIPTPNFPSYPSGHSTISAAAATVLSEFFPDEAHRLEDRAEEAKMSRLWGGIHFPVDNEEGAELGRDVGETVLEWHEDNGW